jgi:sugar phosphate isomerase/epimerase
VPAGGDLNDPDKCMRLCEEYGVNILGISSIPGEMMNSVDGFKAYAQQMNKWAAPFKGTGIRLKYHNHSQEFRNFPELGGKSGMDIFFEETDPELVCFELDTHWVAGAGADPAAWIRKAKGRIPLVHYKDFAINWKAEDVGLGSITKRYAEVGQGNINWENVAQATREAGCEWIFVEQDRTPGCAFESLKTSIDFINKLGVRF